MGWVKKIPYAPPHKCRWPNAYQVNPKWRTESARFLRVIDFGSIWECDECQDRWIYTERGWVYYAGDHGLRANVGDSCAGPLTPKRRRWYNSKTG